MFKNSLIIAILMLIPLTALSADKVEFEYPDM